MNKLERFSTMITLSVVLLAVASVGLLTGTPWVSAQAETEPTVIPLGTRVQHIDPYPWGLMYRHAAEEENLPGVVEIIIYTDSGVTVTKSLKDQITDAGGSNVSGDTWRVPTSALAAIVQRADVVADLHRPQPAEAIQVRQLHRQPTMAHWPGSIIHRSGYLSLDPNH